MGKMEKLTGTLTCLLSTPAFDQAGLPLAIIESMYLTHCSTQQGAKELKPKRKCRSNF